jgi:hypothetical protein
MQATPGTADDLPELRIALTDTGFDVPQPLSAGRYAVTAVNTGTSTVSHFGVGRIPDHVTDAEYQEWLAAEDDTEALSFEEVEFAGVPDWPAPGGTATGIVDLPAGRYFIFDPISDRGFMPFGIDDGTDAVAGEPDADITVELKEMQLVIPPAAFTSAAVRWKIINQGAFIHEVAVLPVSEDFTAEHLHILLGLPDDATPPPGVPGFDYQPVTAIGLLSPQRTSWLDVQLAPGHYLAVCMIPFGTGTIHAAEGMYLFFDVA